MEATQALRCLRKRCFGSRYCASDEEMLPSFYEIEATSKAVFEEWASDAHEYAVPTAQVVVSNPAHLLEKARELERLRAEYQQPPPLNTSSGATSTKRDESEYNLSQTGLKQLSASHLAVVLTHPLDMLHDLVKGYFTLRSQSALTPNEQGFCNHVEQVVLAYLIQMTVQGGDFLGDVHAFFLELILRQSDDPPKLAFTLLYNLHVALAGSPAQVELFFILLDMVDRLVHLSRPIGASTLPLIVGALVHMVQVAPGEFAPERLMAVPISNLVALLHDPSSPGHVAVMEMLVMSLYLRHMLHADHQQDTYGARKSKERFYKGMPSTVCPVDPRTGAPVFDLDTLDPNDANSTIDVLLHHFFATSSIAVHRLVLMVLFDLAKATVQLDFASTERVLASCLEQGLTSVIATFPTVLLPEHLPGFLGRLGDEGQDNGGAMVKMLTEIAQVARVNDYFVQCSTLAHIIQKRRWVDVTVVNSATTPGGHHLDPVQRAMYLIGSAIPAERFKGQRWLAELLSESAVKPAGNDLSPAVDPRLSLRLQARSSFWECVRSKAMATRLAMVQVLALVAKRRLVLSSLKATVPNILREVNTVAKIWVEHASDFAAEDAEVDVAWATLMELVLGLCCRQLSFVHRRAKQQLGPQVVRDAPVDAPSLVRAFAHGCVAFDRDLLHELSGDCYVAALHALAKRATTGVAGAVAVVVKATFGESQVFTRAGGVAKFRSFLEAPHSPVVSVHMAELIVSMVRATNKDVYLNELKDLHLQAQDASDERVLDNPYVHCRQLLARLYHTTKIPID